MKINNFNLKYNLVILQYDKNILYIMYLKLMAARVK